MLGVLGASITAGSLCTSPHSSGSIFRPLSGRFSVLVSRETESIRSFLGIVYYQTITTMVVCQQEFTDLADLIFAGSIDKSAYCPMVATILLLDSEIGLPTVPSAAWLRLAAKRA